MEAFEANVTFLVSRAQLCIYCCICSNRDKFGFYAEIQIIFGILILTQPKIVSAK